MAATKPFVILFNSHSALLSLSHSSQISQFPLPSPRPCNKIASVVSSDSLWFTAGLAATNLRGSRRILTLSSAVMFPENPILSDICACGITSLVALSILRFWAETAKRRIFDKKINRKLVHISIGLVFMLCWPLFSAGRRGAILASLAPGMNGIRVLLLGWGLWKDDATVKSMSRTGDKRELLKGPFYYAMTVSLACAYYWRTSPIAIAAICNLCAGDGVADIIGRRFGRWKVPYNKNKTIEGSVAMAIAGFLTSVGYMYYFASFGYIQARGQMILGFLVLSIVSALVESHPLSTELDDNLTVTLSSVILGSFIF